VDLMMLSSGFWCYADSSADANILEEHTLSSLRADENLSPSLHHLPTRLHGAKTQNCIIILAAVKISNLTQCVSICNSKLTELFTKSV
jgi:hypothetical protein